MAKYTVLIDTYACASFVVEADSPEEADEKAQEFIDSENFFVKYREDCDFFEPTIGLITPD